VVILATKVVSRCWRPLRGEGYSAAGWLGHRCVHLGADCGSNLHSFRQWVATNCTAPPNANAGQYATLHCKPLLFWFPCKQQYSL